MKIAELISESSQATAVKNAFKNVPGVKFKSMSTAKVEDPSTGEEHDGFKLILQYAASRGTPSTDVFSIWKADDEWHYLSETDGGDADTMEDLIQDIIAHAATAAKFHAKSAAIDYTRLMRR